MNILFSWISKLVLSSSIVTFLDASIIPQVFDCFHIWRLEWRHCFKVHAANQLRVFLKEIWSYFILFKLIWNQQIFKKHATNWLFKNKLLTELFESPYWIFSRSIALIIDCIAMKMFWYTSLINVRLSSSEYPLPWIIRICLMKVDLPDSPVPVKNK